MRVGEIYASLANMFYYLLQKTTLQHKAKKKGHGNWLTNAP